MRNSLDYEGISEFQAAINGSNNISKEPLFRSTNGDYNFRLAGGSPCIDQGFSSPESGTEDFDGNSRVIGADIDLGAYEYDAALSIHLDNNHPLSVFPNPFSDYLSINTEKNDEVKIFDSVGKLISSISMNNPTLIMNTKSWNPGIYYVKNKKGNPHKIVKF